MASLLEYPSSEDLAHRDRMVRRADGLLHYTGLTPCLTELLDVAAHRYAGREAVVVAGGDRGITYGQLWTSASRVAGGLLEQGVGIGDRVAIRMSNGERWVQAFLGVLLAGGVPVPIHPRLAAAQVRRVLADSGSVLMLDGGLPAGRPFIDDGAAPGDPALLFYTGGTTGPPKGVELSHENVLSTVEAVIRSWGCPDVDRARHVLALPLSSAAACVAQLLPVLVSGGTVVLAPEFDGPSLLRALDAQCAVRLAATAPLYRSLTRVPGPAIESVRVLTLDDEPVSTATVARLRARFPAAEIVSGWGMTETGGAGMILPTPRGAGGREIPHSGMEFAVAGPDAEVGELWCRGPSVMRGYWGDPATTARAIADGWLHTGDVVRVGRGGNVRFVGRAADAVEIPRGVVYSREIEDAVLAHPGVDEAVVVGVMTVRGPDLGVLVVPEPGVELRLDVVREYLDAPLGHRVPRGLCASGVALPRNARGRVDRGAARARFETSCFTMKGSVDVG